MFCSGCGSQVNKKLRFCNNCGAKVRKDEEEESNTSPINALIAALPFIILGGLGILIGLLAMLLKQGVSNEMVGIIAGCYLIALTAICFNLIGLMKKMMPLQYTEKAESQIQTVPPVQLPAVNTAQLEEMRQPFSVVDNTTRTFEKIPRTEN
jgi:preprotein translocase subunit Sss1